MPVPPSTVTYAGSMQQMDEARAQELVAQDPSLQDFVGAIFRPGEEAAAKANADKSASQYAASQVQGLGHDITTKPGPHTGGHNYMAYQQNDLHQMVNSNADPSGVNQQGQTFNDVGNDFADMAAMLDKATSTASVSWQGKAATGGAAFTTGMSSWHGSTAQGAQYAGTQMFVQSEALGQARASMPAPMATPTTADVQNALLSYNPLDPSSLGTLQNLANQTTASKANHQAMARVAQQYDSALGTSATLPAFTTPGQFNPNPPAGPSGAPAGAPGSGGGSGSRAPSLRSGGGSAGAPAAGGNSSGGNPGGGGGGYAPPPNIPTGQGQGATGPGSPVTPPGGVSTTTQQGATSFPPPSGVGSQGGSSPYPGGSAGSSGGGDMGGMLVGGMPIGGGGFGPTGGGAASYGGGSAGWGPTGSGSTNPGGPAAGQAGARSAAGAAAAEESAVGTGVAGARGPAGDPVGGMGAGRGGKGGEDKEHKRLDFLMESDPESLFGTDEKAIPRVIGE